MSSPEADAAKAREQVSISEREVASIKAQLRSLGTDEAEPNSVAVAWIKVMHRELCLYRLKDISRKGLVLFRQSVSYFSHTSHEFPRDFRVPVV